MRSSHPRRSVARPWCDPASQPHRPPGAQLRIANRNNRFRSGRSRSTPAHPGTRAAAVYPIHHHNRSTRPQHRGEHGRTNAFARGCRVVRQGGNQGIIWCLLLHLSKSEGHTPQRLAGADGPHAWSTSTCTRPRSARGSVTRTSQARTVTSTVTLVTGWNRLCHAALPSLSCPQLVRTIRENRLLTHTPQRHLTPRPDLPPIRPSWIQPADPRHPESVTVESVGPGRRRS
jgi:hypothetical protein